jgi:hypothetical protein
MSASEQIKNRVVNNYQKLPVWFVNLAPKVFNNFDCKMTNKIASFERNIFENLLMPSNQFTLRDTMEIAFTNQYVMSQIPLAYN